MEIQITLTPILILWLAVPFVLYQILQIAREGGLVQRGMDYASKTLRLSWSKWLKAQPWYCKRQKHAILSALNYSDPNVIEKFLALPNNEFIQRMTEIAENKSLWLRHQIYCYLCAHVPEFADRESLLNTADQLLHDPEILCEILPCEEGRGIHIQKSSTTNEQTFFRELWIPIELPPEMEGRIGRLCVVYAALEKLEPAELLLPKTEEQKPVVAPP
ncbi:MAG: hypothetical protein HYS44_00520 [Candidatus Niyogibacteria bacterium]|nr:hypothetical protein [Candidatus Niyogibacteria bacterium]